MKKEDAVFFIIAVVVVLSMAIFVKPVLQGEAIFGGDGDADADEPLAIPADLSGLQEGTSSVTTASPPPTPTPVQTPAWDGEPKPVKYVDPSTYNIEQETTISMRPQPVAYQSDRTMVPYAIISGDASGTTEILQIPSGYWELHLTFEGWTGSPYESYMAVQVRNADDRNDYRVFSTREMAPVIIDDDNVWVLENYEPGNFYFILYEELVKSYTIRILIPEDTF
ncbi:hypothetical protein AZH53_02560 [Methanomicrobiaceae archaeon CYW5]|uniref:hypothetical protein n=1 Tax=Methanovulcanius yangii TaxID=1789227 RepID=UPI0029CA15A5|nr:hypothetical protein [Methanovulcanius yangii]MBT8507312.1 hypothetical protein [Methanovulcanius yangii]